MASSEITTWPHSQYANQYNHSPSHKQTINLLASCLQLQLPVPDTVAAIMTLHHSPRDIFLVYTSAIEFLAHNTHSAEILAEIRMEIAKPPNLEAGEKEYPRLNWTKWQDFGWAFWEHHIEPILLSREEVDDEDSGFTMPDGYDHQQHRRSVVMFIAWTLVKAERVDEWPSMYQAAEDCLQEFLEFEFDALKEDELEKARLRLPHAAIMFKIAAKEIYELSEMRCDFKGKENKGNRYHDAGVWRESSGFSLERWRFWKERWGIFGAVGGLGDLGR